MGCPAAPALTYGQVAGLEVQAVAVDEAGLLVLAHPKDQCGHRPQPLATAIAPRLTNPDIVQALCPG